MSKREKTFGQDFVSGGDLIFHRLALLGSNLLRLGLIVLAVTTISFSLMVALLVSDYKWYVFHKTVTAAFWRFTPFLNHNRPLNFINLNGESIPDVSSAALIKHVFTTPSLWGGVMEVTLYGLIACGLGLGVAVLITKFYIDFGKKAQEDEFLRGQKLVTKEKLAELVEDPSYIKVADVPVPKRALARNFLAVGSMGVGKTVVIDQIIEDARKAGKKLIIYDKTGEFTKKWYRADRDYILNPIDARCADWSIFADLREITDAGMIARFFVPENKKSSDPVWDNAARIVLQDAISVTYKKGGTMADIRDVIINYSNEDLVALFKDHKTISQRIISLKNERGTESVMLTLSSQPVLQFFPFFDKRNATFSIRDYVRRDDDSCLFLTSNAVHRNAIRPFIGAWIDLALMEAMSMGQSVDDLRLMFIIDELASLSKLESLDIALSEARQFGISTVIGMQNIAQAVEIYGEEMTKVYIANLQNKLILRTEEEASAKQLAEILGKEEVAEVNHGLSFGVEASRDGVNLSDKREERFLVTPSELMVLPDLTGYLKLSGAYPIAKVSYQVKKRPIVAEALIRREGLDLIPPSPDEIASSNDQVVQNETAQS